MVNLHPLLFQWMDACTETVSFVRTRVSFAILRSVSLRLRGSRVKWRCGLGFDDGAASTHNHTCTHVHIHTHSYGSVLVKKAEKQFGDKVSNNIHCHLMLPLKYQGHGKRSIALHFSTHTRTHICTHAHVYTFIHTCTHNQYVPVQKWCLNKCTKKGNTLAKIKMY